MDEAYQKAGEEKFRKVQEAYETIQEERGMYFYYSIEQIREIYNYCFNTKKQYYLNTQWIA